ncbi:MAG: hypothetical protein DRJ15_03290 [Bacteroidetes bacterium]|nr:MAG: hypothetical protein DRJ15_03290 [Bacteroidota bacterium]
MRIFTFMLLAVFIMTAQAQKSPVEKFIKKQAKGEGISMQEIDLKSDDFASQFQVEGEEIEEALEQLDVVKILSSDSTATSADLENFMSKAKAALQDDAYIELARIRSEDNEDVGMYANQLDNGLIREMIVLVGESESATMIYVKGNMDLAGLFSSKLFASMIGGKDCK